MEIEDLQTNEDFNLIVTNSKKLEKLYIEDKLTTQKLTIIQNKLNNIAKKYEEESTVLNYWYLLLEQQALINLINNDTDGFEKFYMEAAATKPDDCDFASETAKNWENKLDETNKAPRIVLSVFTKHKKLLLALVVLLVIFSWQPIADLITISSASQTMIKLANDAGMSRQGELVFLRTHPKEISDSEIATACALDQSQNGYVEQGCYSATTHQIFLRQMPKELHDVEVVTAAHEMLHAAYNSDSTLNKALEDEYTSIDNSDLNARIAEYNKLEPGAEVNELHSIMGTEYANLPSNLESFYSPYFIDRSKVTSAGTNVTNLFNNDEQRLHQLNSQIDQLNKNAQTAYKYSVNWANYGNQYENTYNYNIYSNDIDQENSLIDQYNTLLGQYQILVAEYNGETLSAITNVTSQ